jgi:hypothetical protein
MEVLNHAERGKANVSVELEVKNHAKEKGEGEIFDDCRVLAYSTEKP